MSNIKCYNINLIFDTLRVGVAFALSVEDYPHRYTFYCSDINFNINRIKALLIIILILEISIK